MGVHPAQSDMWYCGNSREFPAVPVEGENLSGKEIAAGVLRPGDSLALAEMPPPIRTRSSRSVIPRSKADQTANHCSGIIRTKGARQRCTSG